MIIEMDNSFKSFSEEEFKCHVTRLQDQMSLYNLDGLLLTSPENIYYASGYRSWYTSSLFRPVYVLVPKVGNPAVILRILEKSTVKFTSWTENIYVSGTESRNLGKLDASNHENAFKKAMDDLISNPQRIGLEMGPGLQHFWYPAMLQNIMKANPEIDFCDGSLAIQQARMIKSPWEIEKLKSVVYITEKAILDTFRTINPGQTTEKDISRGIAMRMAAGGVDKFSYLTVSSGIQKYTTLNSYATDRIVQFGENIVVDISGHIDGYASDLTRMIHLDKTVPPEIFEMASVASQSVHVGKELMQPGVDIGSVNKAIEGYIKNSKYGEYLIHSSGHGIGLNVVEYPMIEDNQTLILQPGMVFAVENGVYPFERQDGAENLHLSFRMEDEVLITQNGSEWLSGPGKPIYCLSDFI